MWDRGFEEQGPSVAGRGAEETLLRGATQGALHRRARSDRGLQRMPDRNPLLDQSMFAAKKSVEAAVAQLVQEILAQATPGGSGGQQRTSVCRANAYYQVQTLVDRVVFCEVLEHAKGNQVEAAVLLGISRTTLRSKLRLLGLVVEKQVCAGDQWRKPPDPE
jgi:DNA-binding protein Fis